MGTKAAILDRSMHWAARALLFAFVCIPVSVKIYALPIDLELIFPAELLIALAAGLLLVGAVLFVKAHGIPWHTLRHPIVLLVVLQCILILIATMGSSMPLVSAKAILVKLAYIWVFFGGPLLLLRYQRNFMRTALDLHALAFGVVLVYVMVRGVIRGFDRAGSGFAPFPFYTDHTIYGAALVFVLLYVILRSFMVTSIRWRRALQAIGLVLLFALYASFCRAAWLSVVVVCMAGVFTLLARRIRVVLFLFVVIGVGFLGARPELWRPWVSGPIESYGKDVGLVTSIRSIANVTHDISNLERINRWRSALRMHRDRPWIGFGPGTYQFQYVPYQQLDERTWISVVEPVPPHLITRSWSASKEVFIRANPQIHVLSGGTTHSEYLLTLAEQGLPALIVQLTLLVIALYLGLSGMADRGSGGTGYLLLYAVAALLAYAVHGVFNNYLDDCKVAALYYSTLSIIVAATLRVVPPTFDVPSGSSRGSDQ
jgi:O-antigen ligase